MIDTIVFDIGNVLAAFNWAAFLESFNFSEETRREIAGAVFMSAQWPDVDLGIKTDDELIAAFIDNAPHLEDEIRLIFEKWQYSVSEYPFSEDWLRGLKNKGYKIYLLSNYGRTMFRYARDKFRFFRYTDGGVISYEVNQIKPYPEIYKILTKKYSIVPERAVFLDDLEANLETARSLGFNTVRVTDHESALSGLRALGVE